MIPDQVPPTPPVSPGTGSLPTTLSPSLKLCHLSRGLSPGAVPPPRLSGQGLAPRDSGGHLDHQGGGDGDKAGRTGWLPVATDMPAGHSTHLSALRACRPENFDLVLNEFLCSLNQRQPGPLPVSPVNPHLLSPWFCCGEGPGGKGSKRVTIMNLEMRPCPFYCQEPGHLFVTRSRLCPLMAPVSTDR